jgi:hypothetical protein
MTVSMDEVLANFVPAAAVIRGGQALFGMTGRKAFVGGFIRSLINSKAQL